MFLPHSLSHLKSSISSIKNIIVVILKIFHKNVNHQKSITQQIWPSEKNKTGLHKITYTSTIGNKINHHVYKPLHKEAKPDSQTKSLTTREDYPILSLITHSVEICY
jgi:hypothetical protein